MIISRSNHPSKSSSASEEPAVVVSNSVSGNIAKDSAVQINGHVAGQIYNLNINKVVINMKCNQEGLMVVCLGRSRLLARCCQSPYERSYGIQACDMPRRGVLYTTIQPAEALVFVSALQAATQLLEQAFRVIGRLHKAHIRQKALIDVLARHENELSSIKAIVGIIDDEEDLQIASVAAELTRLRKVQCKLVKLLEELDPKRKGAAKQFARQLTKGSSDEQRLGEIMNELGQVKAMLLLRIQVANVGVMHNMEKRLVANTEVILRVDQFLREEFNGCEGLRIARLLKGRLPSNDGTVMLTAADLKSLSDEEDRDCSEDETLVGDSDSSSSFGVKRRLTTERIILRNTAKQQSLQINAALGEDLWRDINRLVIKENISENESVQVNHATTLEATLLLLDRQDDRIAAARQRTSQYIRRDSVLSP
ncbi:hypothetical protein BDU57DRAFT_443035 [Ampelomyces quisqualis]|uniref:Uncharacterized protein n=1 Tax=Ampelomyces quisqualis TaxID=50730 RepID=A0A6A5QX02_AMPQU|nr:hypothetical protein BDU57DRAFT_443035 [Ampelomyces quisqualis]